MRTIATPILATAAGVGLAWFVIAQIGESTPLLVLAGGILLAAGFAARAAWAPLLPLAAVILYTCIAYATGAKWEWDNGTLYLDDALMLGIGFTFVFVTLPLAAGGLLRSVSERAHGGFSRRSLSS